MSRSTYKTSRGVAPLVIEDVDEEFWFQDDDFDYTTTIAEMQYDRKEIEELAPLDILSQQEINDLLSCVSSFERDNMEDFLYSSGFNVSALKDDIAESLFPELQADKAVEKFFTFSHELESDHDFKSDRQLFASGEAIKNTIRQHIISGDISINILTVKDECDFLKKEVLHFLQNKTTATTKPSEALKLIQKDVSFFLSVFNSGYKKFLNFHNENQFPIINQLTRTSDIDINKVLDFTDSAKSIKFSTLRDIKIAYSPSGGGKTTLTKSNPTYYHEVDKIVEDNYNLFKKIENYSKKNKRFKNYIMSKFFKYCIYNLDIRILKSKVLLLNHPNQVPNCFKFRINEIIIIPKIWNFRIRYFSENIFSLLFCNRYVKKIVSQEDFHDCIVDYFKPLA